LILLDKNIKYTKLLLLIICLSHFSIALSQKTLIKTVVDKETLYPIEYADIIADDGYTITNSEGRFVITTTSQNLKIRRIGYQDLFISVDELSSIDTILLHSKAIELQEVLLGGGGVSRLITKTLNNTYNSQSNKPYTENFFLRMTLKKDGSLFRMMDVSGRVYRKKTFTTEKEAKKNIKVEILNTRKAGLAYKSFRIPDFRVYDFSELFFEINGYFHYPKFYNFSAPIYIDEGVIKIQMNYKKDKVTKGYFIIDVKKNLLKESYIESSAKTPFKKFFGSKWRTVDGTSRNTFYKDKKTGKLHINHFISSMTVELFNSKNKRTVYEAEYNLFLNKDNSQKDISPNFSSKKEIFKINVKYDKTFWDSQKQLLLTKEMKTFLKKLNDVDGKEFKKISNISNE